jgi:hypothetical protein
MRYNAQAQRTPFHTLLKWPSWPVRWLAHPELRHREGGSNEVDFGDEFQAAVSDPLLDRYLNSS